MPTSGPVEMILREELAHGDAVLGTIVPILGHLVANLDHSLFGDETVARVKAMVHHLSRQLVDAVAAQTDEGKAIDHDREVHNLATTLASHAPTLTHCHALTIEFQLAEKLVARNGIDPVLSPLMQALIASEDPNVAGIAMSALAAQARFLQNLRRMELPLSELPGDLFHNAIIGWRGHFKSLADEAAAQAEGGLRQSYDESASRLGLLARLVNGMGAGAQAALSLSHAGVALFLTALAHGANQERELAAVSTNETQLARFALALRSAGLRPAAIEEQFLYLHPEISMPEGFETLRQQQASALLDAGQGLASS